MTTSAKASSEISPTNPDLFAITEEAMRRASRKVAVENKRLGLPLIVARKKKKLGRKTQKPHR